MTLILFTLTMPGCGSWNGVDTGAGRFHGIIKKYLSKEQIELILDTKNYRYQWDDGWAANIKAEIINSRDRKKIENKSQGFRGYDWMVDSIIKYNKIITEKDAKQEKEVGGEENG